jgi:hypothetical protein
MAVHTEYRSTARRLPLLRTALKLDAAVTGANGAAYLVAAGPLSDLLGIPAGPLRLVGAFLLAFAAVVALTARPAKPRDAAVLAVIAANVLWVVDSLVVLSVGAWEPTAAGSAWIGMQAMTVAAFAGLQVAGRRRSRA